MSNPNLSNQTELAAPAAHSRRFPKRRTSSLQQDEFPERLLTPDDVAELLGVPRTWVYDRLRPDCENRLPGFKLGKYWRFWLTDVLAWLEAQR